MTVIIVGPADMSEQIGQRILSLGLDTASASVLTIGVLNSTAIDEWVGIDPVDGTVNLCAPESKPGDTPHTWLRFEGDRYANTSNLVAVRFT